MESEIQGPSSQPSTDIAEAPDNTGRAISPEEERARQFFENVLITDDLYGEGGDDTLNLDFVAPRSYISTGAGNDTVNIAYLGYSAEELQAMGVGPQNQQPPSDTDTPPPADTNPQTTTDSNTPTSPDQGSQPSEDTDTPAPTNQGSQTPDNADTTAPPDQGSQTPDDTDTPAPTDQNSPPDNAGTAPSTDTKDETSSADPEISVIELGEGDDKTEVTHMKDAAVLGGSGNDELLIGAMENSLIDGGSENDFIGVYAAKSGLINGGSGDDRIGVAIGGQEGGDLVTIDGGEGTDLMYVSYWNQEERASNLDAPSYLAEVRGGDGDDTAVLQGSKKDYETGTPPDGVYTDYHHIKTGDVTRVYNDVEHVEFSDQHIDPALREQPPVAANQKASIAGLDFKHSKLADNGTYKLLKDRNIDLRGKFVGESRGSSEYGMTIPPLLRETGMQLTDSVSGSASNVYFNADGEAYIDQVKLEEGAPKTLEDGTTIALNGKTLTITTPEYTITQTAEKGTVKVDVSTDDDGVSRDGISPEGLLAHQFLPELGPITIETIQEHKVN